MVNISVYRMTNTAITTPTIIKTHAQTNPPIVTGKLFDEENEMVCFTLSRKKTVKNIFDNVCKTERSRKGRMQIS